MAEDKNQHVKDYLTFYLHLKHSPQYAVMINGPWGIGKTYLVKQFLNAALRDPDKYVYVSLFGLASLDEIDGALFEAIYPLIGSKVAKIGSRIIKAALRFQGVEIDLKLSDLVDKFNPRIFVFDDLERCEAPINAVMGYINEFVEHNGCKVVIIANENEIIGNQTQDQASDTKDAQGNEYRKRREKIVGKTLAVQSAFDEAFDFFVAQIDDLCIRALLQQNASIIKEVYAQSELNNLRILQQTMWDFERIGNALTEKHRGNAEAIIALLRIIFALSFEIKSGRLGIVELRSRANWLFAAAADERGTDSESRRRYVDTNLADQILSDDILIDVLIKGIVDIGAIRACLDRSRYFVTVANEPAWVTIWNLYDRTDEEFDAAYETMEKQFADRSFVDVGELLHVLGLRLFLARSGVSGQTPSDVIVQGKQYIDDLYKVGKLKTSQATWRDLQFNSFGGLGFVESGIAEFGELRAYLLDRANQAVQDDYPAVGLQLLKEMEADADLFLRHVCLTNSSDNLYYDVPVFASIDADKFVTVFLALHPANQRTVLRAFGARYEYGGLERDLASERPWLEAVQAKLIAKANAMSPIGKYRLMVSVKASIAKALDNTKRAEVTRVVETQTGF